MKTVILEEPGRFRLTETPDPPRPGPGEALVRVRHVGVCGTDLHCFRGTQPVIIYPRVIGHELCVEVVETDPGATDLRPCDLCAVEPYLNCGTCLACRRGRPNCCASLQVLGLHVDGGMREAFTVPVHKLHRSTLPPEYLAMVEMLSIGAHAVRRAAPDVGEHVLVVGAGPIGLGVAHFARIAGARVSVAEISPHRLDFCARHLHPDHLLDARSSMTEQIAALDDPPTIVFEATGNIRSMTRAFDYLPPTGTLVFVGLVQDAVTFSDPDFHRRELSILSSRNATPADFAWVLRSLEDGRIDLSPWITHRLALTDVPEAFPRLLDPEADVVKAVVDVA